MRLVLASLAVVAACNGDRAPQAPPAADPPPAVAVAAIDAADAVDTAGWKEVQIRVLGMH